MRASYDFSQDMAMIRLSGELDEASVPLLRSLISRAAEETSGRIVLEIHELNSISAAGVRCLVSAQQAMWLGADLVVVGAGPVVSRMLRLAAFDRTATLGAAG